MKCQEATDAKTHLAELTAHFNLMVQRKENLIEMGSSISDTRFNAMIMASLPVSLSSRKADNFRRRKDYQKPLCHRPT